MTSNSCHVWKGDVFYMDRDDEEQIDGRFMFIAIFRWYQLILGK